MVVQYDRVPAPAPYFLWLCPFALGRSHVGPWLFHHGTVIMEPRPLRRAAVAFLTGAPQFRLARWRAVVFSAVAAPEEFGGAPNIFSQSQVHKLFIYVIKCLGNDAV